jgi:hypothetical protein
MPPSAPGRIAKVRRLIVQGISTKQEEYTFESKGTSNKKRGELPVQHTCVFHAVEQ